MSRGALVLVAAPGDYGKPRPALVLQSDIFSETGSVVVALLTTHRHPEARLFRKPIEPNAENGLREASEVMVDKLMTLPREKISNTIGRLSGEQMVEVTAAVALFLGM